MTTPSKTKSNFEQLLSVIYAKRPREKFLNVKIVVALNFMCSIIKILHLKYCPVCNL